MKNLINYIVPRTCVLCKAPSKRDLDLCFACENDLPKIINACKQCGKSLPLNQILCGTCLKTPPPFQQTIALFHYQQPIDFLITALKFNHNLVYAKLLGQLMTAKLERHYCSNPKPEVIFPVPLHNDRLRERGYNQALELARPIASVLKIKIEKHSSKRIKNTSAQTLLSAQERQHNVKNAFITKEIFSYKHIAVIDDVITTGNTVAEFCTVLQRAGAGKIDVWCCARA